MQPLFASALQLFRDGNRLAAAAVCERILATDRDEPDALHLLGVLRLGSGAIPEAVELIGQAVAARPNDADFQVDLAEAYRAGGASQRAVDCCRAAVAVQANHAAAFNTLGLALLDLRNPAE